jgi:hypothetical protein
MDMNARHSTVRRGTLSHSTLLESELFIFREENLMRKFRQFIYFPTLCKYGDYIALNDSRLYLIKLIIINTNIKSITQSSSPTVCRKTDYESEISETGPAYGCTATDVDDK